MQMLVICGGMPTWNCNEARMHRMGNADDPARLQVNLKQQLGLES